MVDPVHVPGRGRQQVAALAVGVVDDGVEDRHPAQVGVVAAGQHGQVDLLVDVDPQLAHAGPERPVAEDRRRHDVPAGGGADLVRGDLAVGQRAVGEVPQRPLARDGLVDAGTA